MTVVMMRQSSKLVLNQAQIAERCPHNAHAQARPSPSSFLLINVLSVEAGPAWGSGTKSGRFS